MSLAPPIPEIYTVAFYNTENLFDYRQDLSTEAVGFLESSNKKWTKERYDHKIQRIGRAISQIGFSELQKPPTLIGLAEVENGTVLSDLIQSTYLGAYNYGFIHYNSPDERGMDVALLYNKDSFTIKSSKSITLQVENQHGLREYTRDILKVVGQLNGEKIYLLVNHWPSRHQESDRDGHQRLFAAQRIVEIVEEIRLNDAFTKIIVMGDFNDNPKNESIQLLKNRLGLFNPMEKLMCYKRGSINHNSKWVLFDQILLTNNFLDENQEDLKFLKANIFDEEFLTQNYGKFKGHPYRTYAGKRYLGGFSDHFPVYIQLRR